MYTKRTIEPIIRITSNSFPVILITGPRQVGKTTVFQNCEDSPRNYVSLDDIGERGLAQNDPKLFLEKYPYPLLIDEVQYAPNLFTYIKINVDKEKKDDMYWLTGSQQFSMMRNVSESLAGRVGILNLQGLSQSEKHGYPVSLPFLPTNEYIKKQAERNIKFDLRSLYEIIWRGSFPKLFLRKDVDWGTFYLSYLQTYIECDVRELSVVDEVLFLKFIGVLAARTAQELNYTSIANDVGVSQPTVKSWVSLLRTSGLVYLMQPYYSNPTSRLIKTPKLYFLDTGLVAYLTKYQTPEILENGALSGAILETYIISEILKSYWHNGKQQDLYFYRDKEKVEIDLIIEENGKLYPIEIKKKSNPDKDDIKNFSALNKFNKPIGEGAVICLAQDWLPITREVSRVPVSYL
jgi:predicted AAA+ superfamily ATPase